MNISIKNLFKKYGDDIILNINEFEIENVKSIAIVGPSGGGKSTFLNILSTIEECDSGEVRINNIDIFSKAEHKEYLKEVGFVFQSNNLFPNLTILENVTIHLIYTFGMKKEDAISKAEKWLDKIGIMDHKDKKPNEVSGGQAQRAAIVRALVSGAKLLMLDEPTSALDPMLAYDVMQTLIKIKEETDILIVTHELNFARRFADYFIFIDEARIVSHGPIEDLFNNSNKRVQEFVEMIEFK